MSQTLLGNLDFRQHVAATLLMGRVLRHDHGVQVAARRHESGILLLEHEADGRVVRGYVMAAESSMEPRPIWPALLPLAVPEATPIDWIAGCTVPKMPAIEQLDEHPAMAYVLGWLPADDIVHLPIVTLQPHLGHDFEARYRQAKNHQLKPLATFASTMSPDAAST